MKEQTNATQRENNKNAMAGTIMIILCAMSFLLGWSLKKNEATVKFTEDDIKVISEMQSTYGEDIVVHKTKDGKLMIEWNFK